MLLYRWKIASYIDLAAVMLLKKGRVRHFSLEAECSFFSLSFGIFKFSIRRGSSEL